MFFDIGSLEFITLVILAVLVFGPEKLPKMIQDTARFLRKVREFSDGAKQDIRNELGPEFKDFEFEDLNPRRFAKKHLLDNDDLGLKEITSSLDMRKELTEVTDAVNGRPASRTSLAKQSPEGAAGAAGASGTTPVTLSKDTAGDRAETQRESPPFDADAT
ncbi:sec-independent translocase [Streptomyces litchfieldiae]|uniref:Sec-independent protein translocase protein TatB n=1 Tax=Streptomyces litchfieldiae TaxID=3075543 RepID=A0ABU2MMD2_9ACTN|nr:sec-independent translocase [Streptomyces sp. DSM 44938]MDT0342523.1 sec-independent translocase [Streptomyces sp. DSM 44938]